MTNKLRHVVTSNFSNWIFLFPCWCERFELVPENTLGSINTTLTFAGDCRPMQDAMTVKTPSPSYQIVFIANWAGTLGLKLLIYSTVGDMINSHTARGTKHGHIPQIVARRCFQTSHKHKFTDWNGSDSFKVMSLKFCIEMYFPIC